LIADTFSKRFSHWNITLPEEDIKYGRSGYIQNVGWLIQYCFGKNETDEYMDYYASHRMTDDPHVRIYADGRVESLPAPVEAKRLEEGHLEHNREVVKIE
jgi:hypothetical protein